MVQLDNMFFGLLDDLDRNATGRNLTNPRDGTDRPPAPPWSSVASPVQESAGVTTRPDVLRVRWRRR
jgi:hypothetical protein